MKYRVDPNIGENNNINTRESNRICDKEKHRHHASKIIPTDLMVSDATGLRSEIIQSGQVQKRHMELVRSDGSQ